MATTMVNEMLEQKIANTFGKSCQSYDGSARLQRLSGQKILPMLTKQHSFNVLDLGCGTGYFTEIMARQFDRVSGVDLSRQMLEFAKIHRQPDIDFYQADMHHLPVYNETYDSVFSNLAVQWSYDLTALFTEVHRVLKPGGTFVFTTLLDGTLCELERAWQHVDNDKHVLDFLQFDDLNQCVLQSAFDVKHLEKQAIVLPYNSVKHLAQELKALGASHVPGKQNKGLASRRRWQAMSTVYEQLCQDNIVATYQLCCVKLIKPLTC
ncbi:malonyl-ACP O-methyltransferase BioC [Thalassotalea maritima]|uniref:malonyl-ACP O-methyltransferase BioC n=1 Tax=Thalassotalea maritima TaxID=3242416 RepID=UPI003528747F